MGDAPDPLAEGHVLFGNVCSCGDWSAQCGHDVAEQWRQHVEHERTRTDPLAERLAAVDIEGVLAAHVLGVGFENGEYWPYACTCGWTGTSDAEFHAHQAAAIRAAATGEQP